MLGGGTWPSPFVSVFGGLLAARLAASILGG
jgi:hypothetical protein